MSEGWAALRTLNLGPCEFAISFLFSVIGSSSPSIASGMDFGQFLFCSPFLEGFVLERPVSLGLRQMKVHIGLWGLSILPG